MTLRIRGRDPEGNDSRLQASRINGAAEEDRLSKSGDSSSMGNIGTITITKEQPYDERV